MFFEGINKGSTRSLNTDTYGFLTHKISTAADFFMNNNTNVVAHYLQLYLNVLYVLKMLTTVTYVTCHRISHNPI